MSIDSFSRHTLEDHRKSIANSMSNGLISAAKNVEGTNYIKFLTGLSHELKRVEDLFLDIIEEYDPERASIYLEQWERDLGIPDGCFPGSGTIEERRRDIIVKMGMSQIRSRQDFIDLAALYGFEITIGTPPIEESPFPWTFPHTFGSNGRPERFIMVVTFIGVTSPSAFPWTFTHTWTNARDSNIITCLFDRLVPAYIKVEFQFEPIINYIVDEFGNFLVDEFGNRIVEKIFS